MKATLVIDASVLVDALAGPAAHGEAARTILRGASIAGPEHLQVEVFHALRGLVRRGQLDPDVSHRAVERLGRLPLSTVPTAVLLERMWDLRDNLTGYDAGYVAAAEHLDVDLVTRDRALLAAPGVTCRIRRP
jgi:predicted nucleic acid-binding protein